MNLIEELYDKHDNKYKEFVEALIPDERHDNIIGVRIPVLRDMAKKMINNGIAEEFLNELPHKYYEENQLHSFIICYSRKSFDEIVEMTEEFLPYINNWSVCDSFKPEALKNNRIKLRPLISKWLQSNHTFTIRSAIVMLISWYLGSEFDVKTLYEVSRITSEEYYVNMAIGWYYSMALVNHYDDVVKLLENKILNKNVHNITIKKAIESKQISQEKKEYLRTLK